MPFTKKASLTQQRIEGLDEKSKEFVEDLERTKKRVKKYEDEVGAFLGKIALDNRPEDHKELEACKRLLAKAREELLDLTAMVGAIENEKTKLQTELLEGQVREIPTQMESVAKDFNAALDKAISVLDELEKVHKGVLEKEAEFIRLGNTRNKAMAELGKVEGLTIAEGLGRMAFKPSPWGFVFQCSGDLGMFVNNLKMYKNKLANYENFKTQNPENETKVAEVEEEKPSKFKWLPAGWIS